jgi:hypothetical protein
MGKRERQRGLGTWITPHVLEDLDVIRPALRKAKLFVRVNPFHDGSAREMDEVLARGAQVVMLPMVTSAAEAVAVAGLIDGRATLVLLVEHVRALEHLDAMARIRGVDEVHIGLNDLAISLGLRNRWEALADGRIEEAGRTVRAAGLRFGLAGIGRPGDNSLPIPADLVYAECARTGATASLISRSFFSEAVTDFAAEISRAREELTRWQHLPRTDLDDAHARLIRFAKAATTW